MTLFVPVKTEKISELIVRQIKDSILNGTMRPGDRLPTERDLAEGFQVSRISVREALKSMETAGLLTIKRGAGVFVAEMSSKTMSDSLSSILKIKKISMKELTEARMMFEPIVAKLATERIRAEDFQKLDDNIEQALGVIQSNTPATSLNIEFHTLIARATYNPVIAITMENMFNVWKEWFISQSDESEKDVEHSRNATLFHKEILKALHERDSERVYQLMLEHTLRINQQQSERQSRSI